MPDWKPPLASRLESLRLSPAREQEIIEELSQHLDDIFQELRAAGASPEDAVRGTLDELDERDLLAREMQRLRQASTPPRIEPGSPGSNVVSDMRQDFVYACRTLLASRGWTFVVVLLLALGIGANTALFSATDALLLSPLPVRDPDTLVRFHWTGRNDAVTEHDEYGYNRPGADGKPVHSAFSYAVFRQLSEDSKGAVDLFACAPFAQLDAVIDGQAELVEGLGVTGNYFDVLGVRARAGRLLVPDDDRPTAAPVAVVSSRYWQSRFGGDPAVIGKVIDANGVPVTIVGVTPPDFTGVQQPLATPPDMSFPLVLDTQLKGSTGRSEASSLGRPTAWWLEVMGRLRPAATAAQVQSQLDGVFQRTARAGLDAYLKSLTAAQRGAAVNQGRREIPRLIVEPGRRGVYDVTDAPIVAATLLSAIVAVILLIICANVANLMLSRAIVRQKEIAVRLSLGATRSRLARQLLTEALVLALTGAAMGMAVAYWGVQLLPPPASTVGVFHGRTFAFTVLAAVLTSVVFGAVPAVRATAVDVNTSLKDTGRSITGRRSVLSRGLLIAQVALSLVLLVGAGLFLQTLRHLRSVDVGFDPHNLLLVRVTPSASGYDMPRTVALYRTLLDRLSGTPGVRGAALSQPALLSGSESSTSIYVQGRPAPADVRSASEPTINRLVVSPGFLKVIGIPVVLGRDLTDRDDRSAPRVAVINEAAARTYFPGENPIGRRFGSQPDHASDIEVVGVARDAKYSSLREAPPPTMYVTYMQTPRAAASLALRTDGDPRAIVGNVRQALHEIDPNLPPGKVSTQAEQIDGRMTQEKLFAQACTLFGGVALLLASIGLFGLMSYNVARRTAEMGIRMALGAQRRDVVRMVMRESLWLVGVGVAAGLVLTAASARLVATLLYGLPPRDVPTLLAAIVVMAGVSAAAAYLPARRASRVDPLVALRYE